MRRRLWYVRAAFFATGELAKEEQLHKTIESVLERGEKIDSVSISSLAESAVLTGYSWLQKAMACRHRARCSTRRYVPIATSFRCRY